MKKTTLFLIAALTLNFELLTLNSNAQNTKLFDFSTAEGTSPYGSLTSDGTFLYGMTYLGGANDSGTVFKVMPDGTGYSILLDFAGAANGKQPNGSLISIGNFLYGMTTYGGADNQGTIFKIMHDGTGYSKLLDFNGGNGSTPWGSLVSDGTFLYGMTFAGGTNYMGVIFKIMPDGTGYTKLLDFTGTANGGTPRGSLLCDGTFLYGMTQHGGLNSIGSVFKIKPDGTSYTKLYDFATANGREPFGDLISDGTFLYGMTGLGGINNKGTIFKIAQDGTGFSKLLDFAGDSNGELPYSSFLLNGSFLFGMTVYGGANNEGSIFKIKPDGTSFTKLFDFDSISGAMGSNPASNLITDGTFFYGMTSAGGLNNKGTIFKVNPAALGIAENTDAIDFDVFPNPGNGNLSLTLSTGEGNVSVYNVLGEEVYHIDNSQINKSSNFQIDLSSQSAGVYFVQLETGQGIGVKKIIIQ